MNAETPMIGRTEAQPAWAPPPFCRSSWSSEAARALWEPRLNAVRDLIEDMGMLTSGEGCTLVVRANSLRRLTALAAGWGVSCQSQGPAPETPHAVAAGRHGRLIVRIGNGGPPAPMAACEADPLVDPLWMLAQAEPEARRFDEGRGLGVAGHWASNPMLAAIGISIGQHWPSGFDCPAATARGQALLDAAAAHGREEAANWLREILSWPVSWTALHGIAEIKTPVFRAIRTTPWTAARHTIERQGSAMPEGAARGLGFPFAAARMARRRETA
ncbi:hypothetical protein P6144_10770 [Sphingomonas sp. HITSZ_GF]|uniref:hypothetical protein n=1 Tax=Sphingomonas sp. HITSZ_GF TaxID=3037247 RepID=UPI00240D4164|nr:hypothetical protein [Sphingomonas sp. HITSZ_GF]MDG2534132.1 hypothetical protein [Sphingomonas sp. HITSZ_GF]